MNLLDILDRYLEYSEDSSSGWFFVTCCDTYEHLKAMRVRKTITTLHVRLWGIHCVGYIGLNYSKNLKQMEKFKKVFPYDTSFYVRKPGVGFKEIRAFLYEDETGVNLAYKKTKVARAKECKVERGIYTPKNPRNIPTFLTYINGPEELID